MSVSAVVVSVVLLPLLAAAVWLIRSQVNKTPPVPQRLSLTKADAPRDLWRATSIRCGRPACPAARQLSTVRFLVRGGDMPLLPLSGCNVGTCQCTYQHHRDRRRNDMERRAFGGLQSSSRVQMGQDERRSGRDRRAA